MRSATGQGSNSAQVRRFNERVILSLLRRRGPASKADLARHASLTSNTAGVIVQDLEAQGLIRVDGRRTGGRGQPATLVALDPAGACSIGVKIGRRSIDAILVDFTGRVLDQRRSEQPFPLPEQAVAIARMHLASIRRSVPGGSGPAGQARIAGLGVAVPYNMGCWARELDIPTVAYRAWNEFDLAAALKAHSGLPTLMENDGTAAAVAELYRGRGRDLSDFLYVFIGAAIGGGVVIGGDYHRGVHGNAGDIGLMPVPPSPLPSAPIPPRRFDILLTRASINSLARHLASAGVAVRTRDELDAAILARPDLVDEWLEDSVDALAGPLLSAACVLDVQAIVLDGDLPPPVLDRLIARLSEVVAATMPEARTAPPLVPGRIGRQAAAIGAAILPLHLNYSPGRDVPLGQDAAA